VLKPTVISQADHALACKQGTSAEEAAEHIRQHIIKQTICTVKPFALSNHLHCQTICTVNNKHNNKKYTTDIRLCQAQIGAKDYISKFLQW